LAEEIIQNNPTIKLIEKIQLEAIILWQMIQFLYKKNKKYSKKVNLIYKIRFNNKITLTKIEADK
jgi:hypothetical protein